MSGNDRFDEPRVGLVRQEFITYEVFNNTLYRKTIIRKFAPDGEYDYQDSYFSEPLHQVNK
jgi:hypothetical protein